MRLKLRMVCRELAKSRCSSDYISYYCGLLCAMGVCAMNSHTDPFTVTEVIKLPAAKFAFTSFREIADNLRGALSSGMLKRGKRYEIVIREI